MLTILLITLLSLMAFTACLFVVVQYSVFRPAVKGLPILVYHKVSKEKNDHFTVSVPTLEKQFSYLSEMGYTCLSLSQLIGKKDFKLPKKNFVLTFDDGYVNNLQFLYPLLQKYGFHATIMLPVGHLGKTNDWEDGNETILSFEQLRSMDKRYVSLGLHGYNHVSFLDLSHDDIESEINKCRKELTDNRIEFLPILAYPYGKYPKEKSENEAFGKLLKKLGVVYGMRVGSRINSWPFENDYVVKRVPIYGDESFWVFKTRIKKGYLKRF
jgi:peptidoglycan/xylan/chitin deacetylase (PgdA/CDA1 family)